MPRFRAEIRADFQQVYGVDLHLLWRERQVVRILDLLDGLPSHSRYREAILQDDAIAKRIVDSEEAAHHKGEPEPKWAPRVSEMSPEFVQLQRIEAGLEEINTWMSAQVLKKKSKRKPQPMPLPDTAVERERARRAAERTSDIISTFTPHAF